MRILGRFPNLALASMLCMGLAIWAMMHWVKEPSHELQSVRLTNRLGKPLRVVVHYPDPSTVSAPAAVICQPINDPPDYARVLALELVRDGFVTLTFDWHGETADENRQFLRENTQATLRADVSAAIEYLRSRPQVDPKRVVIAGHSVGGTLAIDAANANPELRAVAIIGMEADVTPESLRNVLWATGLYDEFRSLGHMRNVFVASAGRRAPDNTTVGDFARGSACRLGVSPTADHFNELQDHNIHRMVVSWFEQALGIPERPRHYWMESRGLLVVVLVLSDLILLLAISDGLYCRYHHSRWVPRIVAACVLAYLILVTFASTRDRTPLPFPIADAVLTSIVLAMLCAPYCEATEDSLRRLGRNCVRNSLVLWASVLMTLVVNALPYYFSNPRYLAALPEFATKHVLDLADAYLLDYPLPLVFSAAGPNAIRVRLWVYLLLSLEVLFPGWLFALAKRLGRARRQEEVAHRKRISPASAIVLAALLVFLVFVLWLRLKQGFLTGESARTGLVFLGRYAILPFVFFALLWKLVSHGKVSASQVEAGRSTA